MQVKVKQMREVDGAMRLPQYMSAGASGADLRAVLADSPMRLAPGMRATIWTGIAIELPPGFEAQVRPRSGLTRKGVLVAVGTIDADYRGEIAVSLFNLSGNWFDCYDGDRIAQLVVSPVVQAEFAWALDLDPTARGDNGFGSTGRN